MGDAPVTRMQGKDKRAAGMLDKHRGKRIAVPLGAYPDGTMDRMRHHTRLGERRHGFGSTLILPHRINRHTMANQATNEIPIAYRQLISCNRTAALRMLRPASRTNVIMFPTARGR